MAEAMLNRPLADASTRHRYTAHEYVRETVRHAILSGELPSGTRLVQAELAEQLDVSTTPVREALRDLASEGLIRLDAHRGGVVHELSAEEFREIYAIRLVLEPYAMRRVVERITDEELDLVAAIHERTLADPNRDTASYVDSNREFHLAIYDTAASPRLAAILKGLLDASVMYVSAGLRENPKARERALHDHSGIIDALRARDADKAAQAILDHILHPSEMMGDDVADMRGATAG